MADPITLTLGVWALSGIAGGVLGNRSDKLFCNTTQRVLRALTADPPRNHDVSLAIQRAQLLALKLTLKAYRDLPHAKLAGYSPEDIDTPLDGWIKRSLLKGDPGSGGPAARAIEAQIESALTYPPPSEGPAGARQAAMKALAEDWILIQARDQLTTARVMTLPDWDRFADLLRAGGPVSGGQFPGWWPLFRAFLAEEIKRDDKVFRILVAQDLAKLLDLTTDLKIAIAPLQEGLEVVAQAMRNALDELRGVNLELENAAKCIAGTLASAETVFAAVLPGLKRIENEQASFRALFLSEGEREAGVAPMPALAPFNPARPTSLLLARNRAIPFEDFGDRLADLIAWALPQGEARSVAGRLYVGEGGVGKTRLGLALGDRLSARGWLVRQVERDHQGRLVGRALASPVSQPAQGVLVIVDYCESRPDSLANLARVADDLRQEVGPPLRILALARSHEGWWQEILSRPGMEMFGGAPFDMGARGAPMSVEARGHLYQQAEAAFRQRLADVGLAGKAPTVPRLELAAFDRPLAILMAAYLAARGVASSDGDRLFDALLNEERRHWKGVLRIVDESPEANAHLLALNRAAGQITLLQGAAETELRTALINDPHYPGRKPADCDILIAALERLYPGVGDRRLAGVEPDILGEALVARLALGSDGEGLIAATLTAALDCGGPEAVFRVVAVIERMATHPEAATRAVCERLRGWLESWCGGLSVVSIDALSAVMPDETVDLRRLALAVTLRRRELAPTAGDEASRASVAAAAKRLSVRLTASGHRKEALAQDEMATEIYRDLAQRNPAAFRFHLADSLNNLGVSLGDVGRHKEAMQAARDATDIYRDLAPRDPDAFRPDLALSLNNLGPRLGYMGHREEGLQAVQEAVNIYRDLAQLKPEVFRPQLARSLNNLGNRFGDLGQREAALQATQEATDLYSALAQRNPDAFQPDLARCLHNLGGRLTYLGRSEEALQAIQEAISIRRDLAHRNPDAFSPDLASSLSALGIILRSPERLEEAVRILRPFFEATPDAFQDLWNANLHALMQTLPESGRSEVEIQRTLAELGVDLTNLPSDQE